MASRRRWLGVAALLAVAWVVTPAPVPLYDGVGFPDEPYRFVEPRDGLPAATAAEVRLTVEGGVNTTGLVANSSEVGPQVSVFAPPQAFALPDPTASGEIRLRAEPVAVGPPAEPESNVYDLTLSSDAGPVRVRPDVQSPLITLRAMSEREPAPSMAYRPGPQSEWRTLESQRVGLHNYSAKAPGAGQYVLVRGPVGGPKVARSTTALLVVALAVVLVAGIVAVRLAGARREQRT